MSTTTHASPRATTAMSLWTVVAAVGLGALGVLIALVNSGFHIPVDRASLLFIGASLAVGVLAVRMPKLGIQATATHPFVFCALAVGGPLAAFVAELLGVAGAVIARGKRPSVMRLAFNLGASTVTIGSAAGAYLMVASSGFVSPADPLATMVPALVVAGAVYFLLNTGLVCLVISIEKETPLFRTWLETSLWAAPQFFGGLTASVAILALREAPLGWSVLLSLPVIWLLVAFARLKC